MSVEKFSVSFDPALGQQVRMMAEAEQVTVSAFLAEAARERVRQLLLDQWLDEAAADLKISREELVNRGRQLIAAEAENANAPRRKASMKQAA